MVGSGVGEQSNENVKKLSTTITKKKKNFKIHPDTKKVKIQ